MEFCKTNNEGIKAKLLAVVKKGDGESPEGRQGTLC
jgi:hypothetical protein